MLLQCISCVIIYSQHFVERFFFYLHIRMSRRVKPLDLAKHYIANGKDQEGFEQRYIDDFIGMYFVQRFLLF